MSTVSTFGTFGVARLGIYVAQKALDITGNNITNINNEKYTRQKLDVASMILDGADRYSSKFDQRIGSGAIATGTSQLRDPYLDIRYRNENASVGAMDTKLAGLDEIASRIDEVFKGQDQNGVIEAQFNDLIKQMEKLNTDGAGVDSYETLVRSSASSLLGMFHDYADELETLYNNQLDGLNQDVDRINGILTSIRELNASIRQSEIHGAEALEQKDERNALIDELSNYIRIDVRYEKEVIDKTFSIDKLVIKLNGNDLKNPKQNNATLVDGLYATQLSIADPKKNEKYQPPAQGEAPPADDPVDPDVDGVDITKYQYMTEDGKLTNNKANAAKDYHDNFDVTLAPLRDKNNLKMETETQSTVGEELKDVKASRKPTKKDANKALQEAMKDTTKYPETDDTSNPPKKLTYQAVKDTDGNWCAQQYADGEAVDGWKEPLTINLTPSQQDYQAAAQKRAESLPPTDGKNPLTYSAVQQSDGTWHLQTTTHIYSESSYLSDNTLYGALQSQRELLT